MGGTCKRALEFFDVDAAYVHILSTLERDSSNFDTTPHMFVFSPCFVCRSSSFLFFFCYYYCCRRVLVFLLDKIRLPFYMILFIFIIKRVYSIVYHIFYLLSISTYFCNRAFDMFVRFCLHF